MLRLLAAAVSRCALAEGSVSALGGGGGGGGGAAARGGQRQLPHAPRGASGCCGAAPHGVVQPCCADAAVAGHGAGRTSGSSGGAGSGAGSSANRLLGSRVAAPPPGVRCAASSACWPSGTVSSSSGSSTPAAAGLRDHFGALRAMRPPAPGQSQRAQRYAAAVLLSVEHGGVGGGVGGGGSRFILLEHSGDALLPPVRCMSVRVALYPPNGVACVHTAAPMQAVDACVRAWLRAWLRAHHAR
eukprot:356539-Chlamydomonas_euryale.AAC.2